MRILLLLLLRPLKYLLHIYIKTLKVEIEGQADFETALNSDTPLVVALWHNKLFLLPLFRKLKTDRKFKIAISHSRDGEIPSRLVDTYPNFSSLRVQHNRRHAALHFMVQAVKEGTCLILTPDGPRGPRHSIKPGIGFITEQTSAQIRPFTWDADQFWTLKSWDRFEIPKPFSRVRVRFGKACKIDDIQNCM